MSSERDTLAGSGEQVARGKEGGEAPGLLLVLSAPSGAGKTTLAHRFRAAHPEAVFSISATTRAPRGAERDGVDYHFVTVARFTELVGAGAFAEWAEVHGHRYGTLKATVDEALRAGKIALFDIDVQGGAQIRAHWPEATASVFILPPSPEELERRLRSRSTDAEDVIRRRLAAARAEVRRGLESYAYVVINDELDRAAACLDAIAAHERARGGGKYSPDAEALALECRREAVRVGGWETALRERV